MSDREITGPSRAPITEILPKSGLVYSERGGLAEILCKPKILPLKSAVLEQLQKIEREIEVKEEGEEDVLNIRDHK